ncbi:MAG: RNA polymerase subunit sigma-70 [Planctomycetota bacterium]|nr:MAG: RNA polymerase subunit sigma-70 [Planctomycetota bacterium]
MTNRRLPGAESGRGESVSHWLDGLRAGDSVAAQELWNRYFARLVAVAQARLAALRRDVSGEDVALSAIKSVMLGLRENRFPELNDRDSLWPLLVTITARKVVSEQRRQLALKRSRAVERRWEDVRDCLGVEPTAEFAVEVADELERLVESLGDPSLRRIVEQKLAGWTNEEIAAGLGCSRRTVIRKLGLVRRQWVGEPEGDASVGLGP